MRIFDETRATEFYIEYLGFNLDWEHRFDENMPLYFQVSRGGCVLHLSEYHGDGTPGTKLRVECENVKAYHKELKSKAYKYLNLGVNKMPWAKQELCL